VHEILLGNFLFLIPNLVFFGSKMGPKKIWSKIWIFHGSKVVERGKYSLLKGLESKSYMKRCLDTTKLKKK
jgi:hypothetical protein